MMRLFLFLLLAWTCEGATYYVDFSGGSDAANGTSTGTPWKHLPGDPSATGTPAGLTGITGTIYLKGGVRYNLATASGITVDSPVYNRTGPITITSGVDVGWGAGMPVIDGAGIGNWIILSSVTNATFRRLNMGDTVGSPDPSATAVTLQNCLSNVVDSCVIHDTTTNTMAPSTGGDAIGPYNGDGIYPTYHVITNCTIYNFTQKAIETYRAEANTIVNNLIYNSDDHGIVLTSDRNVVYGNIISNIAMVQVWQAVLHSPAYGIKLSIGSPLTCNSNLVYNNVIAHCHQGGIKLDNGQGGGSGDYNKIFNNTLIDIDVSGSYNAAINFDCRSANINGTMVMNNLLCSEAPAGTAGPTLLLPVLIYSPSGGPSLGNNNTVAYNLYWDTITATHPGLQIGGVDKAPTWANFSDTGSTSPDNRFKVPANGTGNSFPFGNQFFDTDPKFVSYPVDLRLQQASPVKAAGTNLSVYFTKDINGFPRSAWSLGAFELAPFPPVVTNVHLIFTGKGTASGKIIMQ